MASIMLIMRSTWRQWKQRRWQNVSVAEEWAGCCAMANLKMRKIMPNFANLHNNILLNREVSNCTCVVFDAATKKTKCCLKGRAQLFSAPSPPPPHTHIQ
jgi:hypothetical protein